MNTWYEKDERFKKLYHDVFGDDFDFLDDAEDTNVMMDQSEDKLAEFMKGIESLYTVEYESYIDRIPKSPRTEATRRMKKLKRKLTQQEKEIKRLEKEN